MVLYYYVNSVQLKMLRSPKSLKPQLKYTKKINIYKTSNQKTNSKLEGKLSGLVSYESLFENHGVTIER